MHQPGMEAGKIANVLVTDGPLFCDSTTVKMVFVDGRQYKGAEPAVATADSTAPPPDTGRGYTARFHGR